MAIVRDVIIGGWWLVVGGSVVVVVGKEDARAGRFRPLRV
jgi:hypothetical protein